MILTLNQALHGVEYLLAFSLLIQCFEYWRIQSLIGTQQLWQVSVQMNDFSHAPLWLKKILPVIFEARGFRCLILLQCILSVSLALFGANLFTSFLLLFNTMTLLLRWRGAFNGGSDFMSVVSLTGLFLGQFLCLFLPQNIALKAGLWYICIHSLTSYFLSGSVKLSYPGWRNGRALPYLLDNAAFGPLKTNSWFKIPAIACLASWGFIVWECLFPVSLLWPQYTLVWCLIGAVFHFLVFWHFALNRFFWAWCVSYPAIIYCASQL
jgi:hypothetical protein